MALTLSLFVASALGTLVGNAALLLIIGHQAHKAEQKKLAELDKAQQEFIEAFEREQARMKNYAKMES